MSTTETLSREDILREIAEHESRLGELRAMLPSCIKSFYRFRCRPEKFVWTYAETREEAEQNIRARMNGKYGNDWRVISQVVDQYNDPQIAATQCHGNLLTYLSEKEAREFVKDYHANQKGKVADPDRPKHLPMSQIERDVSDWTRLQQSKGVV